MGYTHYYPRTQELPTEPFARAAEDCRRICEHITARFGIPLAREYNRPNDPPVFMADLVCFNGVGDGGHETFYFPRVFEDHYAGPSDDYGGRLFDFCKTNRKPYDLAVTACLVVLKHHLKDGVVIGSDGDDVSWEPAARLVHEVFGSDYLEGFSPKETS